MMIYYNLNIHIINLINYLLYMGNTAIKPNVYFQISIDGTEKGKIIMKLYDDIVPKTAKNFR